MTDEERQAIIDGEHLRVLSLCYYIYAGLNAFFSLFGVFYALMGLFFTMVASRVPAKPDQGLPPFFGLFLGVIGIGMFAFMMSFAILKLIVAKRLRQRRSRIFCIVVAGLSCIGIPFGTALGVFTLLVLSRTSVKQVFDSSG